MLPRERNWRATLLAALSWAACGWGCAGHRVPAIDPSGERIFSGAATTIVSPLAECPLWHRSPPAAVPAAVAPPVVAIPALPVPTCPPPLAAVAQPIPLPPPPVCVKPPPAPILPPSLTNPPCNQPSGPIIKVTPHNIVAPVCSEVVIAAGLCDPGGFFLTGQPLEWMIPEGSIGEIVQVGRETRTGFTSFLRHSPQKVGTNYVRAYTSSIAQTIDRGTASPLDDVSLAKGQSWISVTSPTEGTTYVTVWAPKEKDWERRRATARIHWVDAKWTFPPPQVSRFGQPVRLSTRIFRANGAPVAGWLVRYDVVGGPEASFGAGGQKSVEAPTLSDGTATVELLANTTTPGITQVRVQIVRPGSRGGGDMIVGQGLTSVTWSSPGLQVTASGPETAPIDGTLSYRVEVINNGDMVARDATLSFVPPETVEFVSSTPPASPLGQTLVWRLGDLQPRTAARVQINCRATMAADVRARFRAETADNLAAEASVSTRVFASALSIRMAGPESAEVGQTAQFRIELTNTSRAALTNIRVRDTFDPGLSEVNNKRSPIDIAFEQLAPGETRRFAVTFRVNEPGEQCHRIDATADGGHSASTRGCVTGIPAESAPGTSPPPAGSPLSLEIQSSGQIEVGQRGIVQVDLVNRGSTPVTNLQLMVDHPPALQPTQASSGAAVEGNAVVWQIESLRPNERASRQVEFEGLQVEARASVRAAIVSDQTAEQAREATIRVVRPAITPPGTKAPPTGSKTGPMKPAPPPAANANNLQVSAADNPDPVKAGGEVTYLIEVANAGTREDSDVVLGFTLPEGFSYKSMSEATGRLRMHSFGGGRYELTPIESLPAGQKFGPITLKATATRASKASLTVNVKSTLNPQGLEFTAETTVLP